MSKIRFETQLLKIHTWTLVRLPASASSKLASRGMVMVNVVINDVAFEAALEPDGAGSHWFRITKTTKQAIAAEAGDTVSLEIEPVTEWSKPALPDDLQIALTKVPAAKAVWDTITPKAQWEWLRWIRATKQPQTRTRRITVACSKLSAGDKRPCCFNSSACSEPYISSSGILIESK